MFVPSAPSPAGPLVQVVCCGAPAVVVLRIWWSDEIPKSSAVSSTGYVFQPSNLVYRRAFLFDHHPFSAPEVDEFLRTAAVAAGALLKKARSTERARPAMPRRHLPRARNS